MIKDQKYIISVIGLLSVLTLALIPGDMSLQADDVKFYGAAEMILYDVAGNEKFKQTVHNQLTDTGEAFLLGAVFADAGSLVETDATSIGAICVSLEATANVDIIFATDSVTEALNATSFDTNDGLDTNNCEQSNTGGVISSGVITFETLTFEAGINDNNLPAAGTITMIGICQNVSGSTADFGTCAAGDDGSTGILFAVINTSDVTLTSGETVDITYSFDISSSTS